MLPAHGSVYQNRLTQCHLEICTTNTNKEAGWICQLQIFIRTWPGDGFCTHVLKCHTFYGRRFFVSPPYSRRNACWYWIVLDLQISPTNIKPVTLSSTSLLRHSQTFTSAFFVPTIHDSMTYTTQRRFRGHKAMNS